MTIRITKRPPKRKPTKQLQRRPSMKKVAAYLRFLDIATGRKA